MRKVLFAATVGLLIGGVAYAEDFMVVGSTDPRIPKGAVYSSGERIYLASGATLTLVNSAGSITPITGRTGGVVLPSTARPAGQTDLFASLRAMIERPQARRTFGAMRGGRYDDAEGCPAVTELTSLEAIAAADKDGCSDVAGKALEAFVAGSATTVAAPVETK